MASKKHKKAPVEAVEEKPRDLTAERDALCVPIAQELLLKIVQHGIPPMGIKGESEEALNYFYTVYDSIVAPTLLKHNIKMKDIEYIYSIMVQPFSVIGKIVTISLNGHRQEAEQRLWKLDDIDDLTIGQIDAVLKEGLDKKKD